MSVVSILLPVYNNKEDIVTAIQSVLDQTYRLWELIIIDDCSTDGTKETIQIFLSNLDKKYNIIFISNEKNSGVYISLNKGLIIATGDYICRIDSDDKIVNNYFELNVNVLNSNPNLIATQSWGQRYINDKYDNPRIAENTLFYRKEIIKDIGYYDSIRFGADSEFLERVQKKYGKNKIRIIDKITYYLKKRENSLTRSKTNHSSNQSIRNNYVTQYRKWHRMTKTLYIPYPLINRLFEIDNRMLQ